MRYCLLLTLLFTLLPTAYAQRYALIIGNSQYAADIGKLKNPVNDATDMAALLKRKHFKVTVLKNASKRQMKNGINAFTRQLSQKDAVGLFFFAGHGMEVGGRNYLIPIGANIQGEGDVEYESVDAGRVMNNMKIAGNNLNMVILDACRNNPFARSFRSTSRGLARMDPPEGSLILYATSPGKVAADGKGRNGLFTKYLLQAIDTPNLTVENVFKATANKVYRATSKKQLPYQSGVMLGDFYFSGGAQNQSTETIPPFPVESGSGQNENIFWRSIRNESNAAYFESYLQQYPKGAYATLARIKLNQARAKVEPRMQVAHLTLKTSPADARVRILNIGPKYHAGIELKPGAYHLEVSKPGYQRHTEWLELAAEEKIYSIVLAEKSAVVITDPVVTSRTPPGMVNIPKDCFQMGSPSWEADRQDNEQRHQVCVNAFQMGKKEVTVGEFRKFVRTTGYRTEAEKNIKQQGCYAYSSSENKWAWRTGQYWDKVGFSQTDQHPVVCVSWNDVQNYIAWLNESSAGAYRLPTEAEWEYAARAGAQSAYFWGNEVDSKACRYANINDKNWANGFPCDDDYKYTAPVGNYRVNDFGLYDMTGNVWEWTCSKREAKYSGAEKRCVSKNHANSDDVFVLRGGSFVNSPPYARVAFRSWYLSWKRVAHWGFRLARTR